MPNSDMTNFHKIVIKLFIVVPAKVSTMVPPSRTMINSDY